MRPKFKYLNDKLLNGDITQKYHLHVTHTSI